MRPQLLSTIFSNPADLIALIWALMFVAVFLSLALVVRNEVGVVLVLSFSSGEVHLKGQKSYSTKAIET